MRTDRFLFCLLAILLVTGCGSGRSAYVVKQFLPEYDPPARAGQSKTSEAIRVEPFSSARAFASTAMFFRPSPHELGSYSRERWRVMPGDMVTDFLSRDLRASGSFKAVLGHEDPGEGRYLVTGTVEEFLEVDGTSGTAARLSADVTLMDVTQREMTRRVIFQRTYTVEEAMKEKSARALAESMSRSLKKFTGQVITDIHREVGSVKGEKEPSEER